MTLFFQHHLAMNRSQFDQETIVGRHCKGILLLHAYNVYIYGGVCKQSVKQYYHVESSLRGLRRPIVPISKSVKYTYSYQCL